MEPILEGTFSERHPELGKMRTCQFCGARRREFGTMHCCNPGYSRVVDDIGHAAIRRMHHKKHGQSWHWKIRQLTHLMQAEGTGADLIFKAQKEMHVRLLDVAAIPSFAEKYFHWLDARKTKAERKRVRESRRINRA